MNEMPTTFVSLVVKRNCTGGPRPSLFMGISRSELFPGFNRCMAEWKSPLIRSIVPEPDHRHSALRQQRAHNVSAFCTSWIQGDTLGKSEMMNLSKSLMKPSTNLCSQLNIAPQLSFRYDKWLSLRNEYDLPFEMRICTCVIKPFGSLQVVIRFSEWQAAGSRIRRVQTSESRCQNYLFEMIYDSLFESRAVSIGRKSDRNGSETRSESRD